VAVDLGHLEVEKDDRGLPPVSARVAAAAIKKIQGLLAVVCDHDLIDQFRLLQRGEGQLNVVGVVLDQQERTQGGLRVWMGISVLPRGAWADLKMRKSRDLAKMQVPCVT
jgi:hypothetical protein